MAEEDLNKAQAVTEQDLNKADPVNQQDLNKDGLVGQKEQDDTLADGTDPNKQVPYSKLKEAADGRKAAEEQAANTQRQLEILQANMQGQQQATQPKQVNSTYEQAMLDLGLTADDLYGENMIKVQNRKAELDTALQQFQTAHTANQQFITSHPDFTEVVGSVNPTTGQIMSWSKEASALLQKKPYLAGVVNTAQGAYQAILDERKLVEFEKNAAVNQEHLNRQNLDNASQPLGGSAAGSGGAGDPNNQPMMSREQVQEIERKLVAGEIIT